jgi:hypothetical protein
LQELVRVFKKVLEFIALSAESFGRELRGDFDSRYGGILRNVANLIDLDARFTCERGFQLFGEGGGFCVAAGECAHKARELWLGESRRKVDAGNPGACQQLSEAFFTGGGAERHTIQQNLVPRRTEQQAAADTLIERTSEFFPRSLKLRRRPHVAKFIEACKLE